MADSQEPGASPDASQITFKVKTSTSDKQHTITMPESTLVSDLKQKLSGPDFEDIPVERQRLIFSGRVLKNEEPLSTYKIKSGNMLHLVKSAASNPAPQPSSTSTTTAPAAPQIPTNMAAGTANNPLAGLTGARYAGLTGLPSADMFGPDGGMVGSMMDEDSLANMLSNPNVAQQMNEMMNNDQFLDLMIQSNPMLRDNPEARQLIRSPMFRQMMTNPDAIRNAARIQRMMRGQNSQGSFPMPGVTDNTPADGAANNNNNNNNNNNASGNNNAANPSDPLAGLLGSGLFGGGGGAGDTNNMLNALFSGGGFGAPPAANPASGAAGATGATGAAGTETASSGGTNSTPAGQGAAAQNPMQNPFASLFGGAGAGGAPAAGNNPFGMPPMTPEALQQMMQMLGGMSGSSAPAAPPDNRPPEERYAEQLRQLNDMGFFDFDRNVAALRRSGGSVQGAIEHLLNSS